MSESSKMHDGQAETSPELVRGLLRARFPQWAGLPVRPLASGGTVNAVYRVGEEFTARLPLLAGGARVLDREAHWLPRLAPLLPLPIPKVVGIGEPGGGYPHRWALHRWMEGENLLEGLPGVDADTETRLARDLASFVVALRKAGLPGGPKAHRSVPLHTEDAETRAAIGELRGTDEPFDADALLDAWQSAVRARPWDRPPCWVHSDLMPSNLVGVDGRLTGILDFGTVGLADPAVDLIPAWNLLGPAGREAFREAVDVDEATWCRGRGWALSMAAIQLPYYRLTNPVISANARYAMTQVLLAEA